MIPDEFQSGRRQGWVEALEFAKELQRRFYRDDPRAKVNITLEKFIGGMAEKMTAEVGEK